ncbi:hypothetical protein GCM10011414_24050 [Croceivirga lutea]|uniref:head GIN domain-containing protein n=1 Tax=Croceivirga lutea TaxID=1775167 RepID=UPI001639BF3A|nr:head GIN domain-containing protein [Croceivirga lutea]GGG53557.1 hypothetical protein GCM10011414_24050 [Croceivirga lutea]
MRVYGFILFVFVLISCGGENTPDCFQSAGDMQKIEVGVTAFENITVFENLNLVLTQGDDFKVEIESGENLINDITAKVEDDRLILRNENDCNWFRTYGISTVYVTCPDLKQLRSSTGGLIQSNGPLGFESLSLVSESFNVPEAETTDGSFDLELNTETVGIVVNGIAYFKLRGNSQNLSVNIASGDSRIEAQELIATNVVVNHRGTNNIIVNPQEQISGVIRSYGDVICVNRPPSVLVDEQFEGKLIFQD